LCFEARAPYFENLREASWRSLSASGFEFKAAWNLSRQVDGKAAVTHAA
jgi:hypothetical protein